jgi:O-antigen/teichoic acid export membrane protein
LPTVHFHVILKNFINVGLIQFAGMMLQILTIPLITIKYGLEIFGEIALTTSVAYMLGNIINYGTNQTEVKYISINRENSIQLSNLFFNTLWLRVYIFSIIATFSAVFIIYFHQKQVLLWISIIPFLFAEIVNPIYFLVGIEKIHWISWGNVIVRLLSFLLVVYISLQSNESILLNLFVGVPIFFFNLFYLMLVIRKCKLKITLPHAEDIKEKVINNFQVMFNGNIGMLQQSIFLFFVAGSFNASILGAYGIIDKLLNAIRQIISAFSTAIYPRAAQLFHESKSSWLVFRFQIQKIYFFTSILLGLFLYFFADQIVFLISNEENQLGSDFIQLLSPAPLFLSLNANNVLDFLLNKQYKGMFWVSIFILLATVLISFSLTSNMFNLIIGWYPLFIEATCLLIYTMAVKKYKLHAS